MEDIEKGIPVVGSRSRGHAGTETPHSDSAASEFSVEAGVDPQDPGAGTSESDDENDNDGRSETRSIGNQRAELSPGRLVVALAAISVSLFVSFVDQTGVSTAVPAVSAELQTGSATAWISASFLIASTSFQLVNGRLSDLFGRKNCMLVSLLLLALGDLLAGFARTKEQLFALRAVAGIGGGGVNSIAMIVVSDVTTLENRGIYQGVIGAVVGLANGIGPFLGGAVVARATWRWIFWMVPMLAVPAAIALLFFLPLRHDSKDYLAKAKHIDYGGVVLNLAAVLLILIPLSGGGVTYSWSSPTLIAMLTVGFVLVVAFLLYEWKVPAIPITPLHLFTEPHCWPMYVQSFFSGIVYYCNFFYRKIYFQSVLGFSSLESGALILPLIVMGSIASVSCGRYMARFGRYMPPIVTGYSLWIIGLGLRGLFTRSTQTWKLVLILLVEGVGVGLTMQPTLVGLLANSKSEDRAVLTGLRNFLRTIGGGFGIIISGAILSNTLSSKLSHLSYMTPEVIQGLTSSAYAIESLGFTRAQDDEIIEIYMTGLHYIFAFNAACAACNLLLCVGIGNTDLKAKSKKDAERRRPAAEDGPASHSSDEAVYSEEAGVEGHPQCPDHQKTEKS